MKSRICPYRMHCHDAGECETCDFHKAFENLNKKINRQNSEIERLQGYNENLLTANTALSNEVLDIKTEAIKEFAERLSEYRSGKLLVIQFDTINKIVKEILGDV